MKKLVKGAMFLALVGTTIVGCEKEDSNLNSVQNQKLSKESKASNHLKSNLNYLEKVGLTHNNGCEYILENHSLSEDFSASDYNELFNTLHSKMGEAAIDIPSSYFLVGNSIQQSEIDNNYNLAYQTFDFSDSSLLESVSSDVKTQLNNKLSALKDSIDDLSQTDIYFIESVQYSFNELFETENIDNFISNMEQLELEWVNELESGGFNNDGLNSGFVSGSIIGVSLYSAKLWDDNEEELDITDVGMANVIAADVIGAAEGLFSGILIELVVGGGDFTSDDIVAIAGTATLNAILNSATGGMGYAVRIWRALW